MSEHILGLLFFSSEWNHSMFFKQGSIGLTIAAIARNLPRTKAVGGWPRAARELVAPNLGQCLG